MPLKVITEEIPGLTAPVGEAAKIHSQCTQDVIAADGAKTILAKLENSGLTTGVLYINKDADSMYIPPFIFNDNGAYSGGFAVVNVTNPLKIGDTTLPLGISLMHELGHAVQYQEDRGGFEAKFRLAQSGTGPKDTFNITNSTGAALTKKIDKSKVAQLMIENDNVARHEAPICSDLGLPFRKKYS